MAKIIEFFKYHGLGNDFIIMNDLSATLALSSQNIAMMCRPHFGIGADGLIIVHHSAIADFEMAYYNADGTKAEMCGNGIRCLAKYVADNGLWDRKDMTVKTGAGIKNIRLLKTEDVVTRVQVNMGMPEFAAESVPVISEKPEFINEAIDIDGRVLYGTAVSMGNPHCVIFVESLGGIPVDRFGPAIENMDIFPRKINVEFVEVLSPIEVKVRVWERGVGETLACGTGACAVAAAGVKTGILDHHVRVHLLGGILDIDMDDDRSVMMTGPVKNVFKGSIDISDLELKGE